MAKLRIGDLLEGVKHKTWGDPTGLEAPTLYAMLDHTAWALRRPGSYTERFMEILRKDVAEAKQCLEGIEAALPTMDTRTNKEWKKRKR